MCWLGETFGSLAWEAVSLGGGQRNREVRITSKIIHFLLFLFSGSQETDSTILLAFIGGIYLIASNLS